MSKIAGKAKRFDGSPVDYVLLFDWPSGTCIGKAVPDTQGNWSYRYFTSLTCGITYVADGCEPITHGAYNFTADFPPAPILHYPFDGDAVDYSASRLNGIQSGALSFVEGRKAGTQAIKFTNGCVRTPSVLPINSNKITISLWLKTINPIPEQIIAELGINAFEGNAFFFLAYSNRLQVLQRDVARGRTNVRYIENKTVNNWQHLVLTMDRSEVANNKTLFYVNNVLTASSIETYNEDVASAFVNDVLYIGQRTASNLSLDGQIQDFRVYNRILTAAERTLLFNE